MKRKALWAVAVIAVLLLVVVVALPFLFDANRFLPEVELRLTQALGRQVKIGSLKLALFSGGIQAKEISIADDPAFSREPFIKAQSLDVGVQMKPLLFDHKIKIESLILNEPVVRLLQSPSGKWNYSTLGQKQTTSSSQSSSGIEVSKLAIAKGRLEIGRANGKQQAFTDVDVKLSDISDHTAFPFAVSAIAPSGGKIELNGKAGPLNQASMDRTPFTGDVKISNLDLAALGMLGNDSGIGGQLNYSGKISSDGQKVTSDGSATASKLKLVKGDGVAQQPLEVKYHSNYDLAREQGSIEQTSITTGKSTALIAGNFASQGSTTNLDLRITSNKMSVQDIQGLLPAFGVILPSGSSLQGGTVDTDLNVRGPLEKLVTTGSLNISNAKLAGFSLGKGLSAAASLAGIPSTSDTTIQTFSSNLRVAPEGIRSDNLLLVVPALGTITGNGTVGADSTLDFHLVAKLENGGGAVGALTQLAGIKGGLKNLPVAVKGTTAKPVFIPDLGSAVSGAVAPASLKQNANPVSGILGMFGKKKK